MLVNKELEMVFECYHTAAVCHHRPVVYTYESTCRACTL